MGKKKSRAEQENLEPDMTPMLDIVFILLIFFIVTTSFVKEEGLVINRPKLNKSNTDNNSPSIIIEVSDTGLITFNGKQVDIERIPARIESFLAKNETTNAIVIPEYDTRHEDVVNIIDQIKVFDHLTVSIGKTKTR